MINEWIKKGIEMGGDGEIVLPHGRLSYSSINMLKASDKWVEHYLKGNKQNFTSASIQAGQDFAKSREENPDFHTMFPSLDIKEKTLVVPIELAYGINKKACLLAKMDGISEDFTIIQDDKMQHVSTKSKWTQSKVFYSLQFRLYSLAVYEHTGIIPKVQICIVETWTNPTTGQIEVTGNHEMIYTQYTKNDMQNTRESFTASVLKANDLIRKFYENN